MPELRTIDAQFERWDDLLSLILSSFAYMDPIIDPPSSAKRLTAALLKDKAAQEIGFVVTDKGGALLGCMFCKPESHCLYLGKLAVLPSAQGCGIGRRLLQAAQDQAKLLRLDELRLETRIELTANHQHFGRWGFVRTAEKSHPGFERVTFVEMRKRLDE